MGLVEFLRARLDEDEQAAQAFARGRERLDIYGRDVDPGGDAAVEAFEGPGGPAHPARVLAEVEATRRIVDQCVTWMSYGPVHPADYDRAADGALVDAGQRVLRLLALPYAGHEDYRDEWRP